MHKLVLCSGGIFFENESDPILDRIFSLIDEAHERKMVYLPTAHRDNPEDEAVVNDYCRRHGFVSSRSLYLTDPNLSDEEIHRAIAEAAKMAADQLDRRFIDYIIIGTDSSYSFADERIISFRPVGKTIIPMPFYNKRD